MDKVISDGGKKGQHIYPHNLDVSSTTVYRHIQLTQKYINLVYSHINIFKRATLNGKSAYELFSFTYGEEVPKILGISKIPAEDVCQSPILLQHKI